MAGSCPVDSHQDCPDGCDGHVFKHCLCTTGSPLHCIHSSTIAPISLNRYHGPSESTTLIEHRNRTYSCALDLSKSCSSTHSFINLYLTLLLTCPTQSTHHTHQISTKMRFSLLLLTTALTTFASATSYANITAATFYTTIPACVQSCTQTALSEDGCKSCPVPHFHLPSHLFHLSLSPMPPRASS